MNRLIFAIMFAIALALSFVRVTGSNMGMTDDFQSDTQLTAPTSWLSKVMHIFGEYKPSAGTVTLAATVTSPPTKSKTKKDLKDQPADSQPVPGETINGSMSQDGFDVSAVVSPDSSDSSQAVAKVTVTNPGTLNEPGCPTCKVVIEKPISSDLTKQQAQLTDLMAAVLAQAKNAKDGGKIDLSDNDDSSGKHKKKKDDDDVDQDKHDAQVAVDTCKAKKVKQNKDGDWVATGKYVDVDSYNSCLQKMAKKFKTCMESLASGDDCGDGDTADLNEEVSRKLATALPQAFQACLAAEDACDRGAWSKWQTDNPAQAMVAWSDYMTKQYPSQTALTNQINYFSKLGPQGLQAAYNLVGQTTQKLMNSDAFASDVSGYNAMRAAYADNKPDDDDPHAAMANAAYNSSLQISSPNNLSTYTNWMGTIQQAALKQGYDVTTQQTVATGQTQTALAGNSGLSPLTVQAVQAAGLTLKVCGVGANGIADGRDCDDRGRNFGTGALGGLTPSSNPTDLGLLAFRLGQQNSALTSGLNAGLVNGTSIPNPSSVALPWANSTNATPSLLQQNSSSLLPNSLNMTPSRVSGLRQVGS